MFHLTLEKPLNFKLKRSSLANGWQFLEHIKLKQYPSYFGTPNNMQITLLSACLHQVGTRAIKYQ